MNLRRLAIALALIVGVVRAQGAAAALLYASLANSGQVAMYNSLTGASVGQFSAVDPQGLAFGPDGNLYVANNLNGSGADFIARYSPTGQFLFGFNVGTSVSPGQVTFGPNGNLFVALKSSVVEYNPTTGQQIGGFSASVVSGRGIAWGPDGNLYATNNLGGSGADFISRFSPTGQFLFGFNLGTSVSPGQLTFGSNGNLYVALGSQVVEYNPTTGQQIGGFSASVVSGSGIAWGPDDGNLYATNNLNGSGADFISRFSPTAQFLFGFNVGTSTGPAFLTFAPEPSSVAVAGLALTAMLARRKRPQD